MKGLQKNISWIFSILLYILYDLLIVAVMLTPVMLVASLFSWGAKSFFALLSIAVNAEIIMGVMTPLLLLIFLAWFEVRAFKRGRMTHLFGKEQKAQLPGNGRRITILIILGIFLVVTIPVYREREKRGTVSIAYHQARDHAEQISKAFKSAGKWPENKTLLIKKRGQTIAAMRGRQAAGGDGYILSVAMDSHLDDDLRGLSFTLTSDDGGKSWTCEMDSGSTASQLAVAYNISRNCFATSRKK